MFFCAPPSGTSVLPCLALRVDIFWKKHEIASTNSFSIASFAMTVKFGPGCGEMRKASNVPCATGLCRNQPWGPSGILLKQYLYARVDRSWTISTL